MNITFNTLVCKHYSHWSTICRKQTNRKAIKPIKTAVYTNLDYLYEIHCHYISERENNLTFIFEVHVSK